jgi:hypothetical protein
MKNAWLALIALIFAGCAAVKHPLPEGYSGLTAYVHDSWSLDENEKDQVFALLEVNGVEIINAISDTRRLSFGRGFQTAHMGAARLIPAQRLKVQIRGTHFSSAPIAEIARRTVGTFLAVEGTLEFNAAPKGEYRVTGALSKKESCVWIEDIATKLPATEKICSP